MEPQPSQIQLYLFVIGVIWDRRFEPGRKAGNFFSSASPADDGGAKLGNVFRQGRYKICEARAGGKALLEVGWCAVGRVRGGGCGGKCATGME